MTVVETLKASAEPSEEPEAWVQTERGGSTAAMRRLREAIQPGRSHPLGATPRPGGVNFSIYSKDSTGLDLLLFDAVDDPQPARVIALDPARHRTYHYWHAFVPGISAGQIYAYRVQGPTEPARQRRFDGDKVLIDPYGRCVAAPSRYDREAAAAPGDNTAFAMKSVVADLSGYDWEGDEPLQRPFAQTLICTVAAGPCWHLCANGFTNPSSPVNEAVVYWSGLRVMTLEPPRRRHSPSLLR